MSDYNKWNEYNSNKKTVWTGYRFSSQGVTNFDQCLKKLNKDKKIIKNELGDSFMKRCMITKAHNKIEMLPRFTYISIQGKITRKEIK